jgi:hypothetical protein
MKNLGNLHDINSLPTVPTSLEIVALFGKIYVGEPIPTVFSVIGEDVPVFPMKGKRSHNFLLKVFFMNHLPPSPWK